MRDSRCPAISANATCHWKDTWRHLDDMRRGRQLCDVTLCAADGASFAAHSAVLAASCELLNALCVAAESASGGVVEWSGIGIKIRDRVESEVCVGGFGGMFADGKEVMEKSSVVVGRKSDMEERMIERGWKKMILLDLPADVLEATLDFMYGVTPRSMDSFQKLRVGAERLRILSAQSYCDKRLEVIDGANSNESISSQGQGNGLGINLVEYENDVTSLGSQQSHANDVREDECAYRNQARGGYFEYSSLNSNGFMCPNDTLVATDDVGSNGQSNLDALVLRSSNSMKENYVSSNIGSSDLSVLTQNAILQPILSPPVVSVVSEVSHQMDSFIVCNSTNASAANLANNSAASRMIDVTDNYGSSFSNASFARSYSYEENATATFNELSLLADVSCKIPEASCRYPNLSTIFLTNTPFSTTSYLSTSGEALPVHLDSTGSGSNTCRSQGLASVSRADESVMNQVNSMIFQQTYNQSDIAAVTADIVSKRCCGLTPPRDMVHDAIMTRMSLDDLTRPIECPALKRMIGEPTEPMEDIALDFPSNPNDSEDPDALMVDCESDVEADFSGEARFVGEQMTLNEEADISGNDLLSLDGKRLSPSQLVPFSCSQFGSACEPSFESNWMIFNDQASFSGKEAKRAIEVNPVSVQLDSPGSRLVSNNSLVHMEQKQTTDTQISSTTVDWRSLPGMNSSQFKCIPRSTACSVDDRLHAPLAEISQSNNSSLRQLLRCSSRDESVGNNAIFNLLNAVGESEHRSVNKPLLSASRMWPESQSVSQQKIGADNSGAFHGGSTSAIHAITSSQNLLTVNSTSDNGISRSENITKEKEANLRPIQTALVGSSKSADSSYLAASSAVQCCSSPQALCSSDRTRAKSEQLTLNGNKNRAGETKKQRKKVLTDCSLQESGSVSKPMVLDRSTVKHLTSEVEKNVACNKVIEVNVKSENHASPSKTMFASEIPFEREQDNDTADVQTPPWDDRDSSSAPRGGGGEFRCSDCLAVFVSACKLQTHRLKVHRKGRLFTCTQCSFRSPRKKDVQAHMLAQHDTVPPGVHVHACTECAYKCVDKNRFEEHEAMHTRLLVHRCTLCEKSFTTRRGMRTHVKYHSASRPHRCDRCSAAFKVRAKLSDHVRLVHEQKGFKPYRCAYCAHATALRGNCNQHIRKHHPGRPVDVLDMLAGQRRAVREYDYAGLAGAGIEEDGCVGAVAVK